MKAIYLFCSVLAIDFTVTMILAVFGLFALFIVFVITKKTKMSYDILQPNAVTTSVLPLSTSAQHNLGIDSKSLKIQAKSPDGVSGAFAKCTFTNINGTYGDQKIGKIVATFSDLKPTTGNGNHNTDANNLSDVEIYFDPSDGFCFNNTSQVHVDYQVYDRNNDIIKFQ